jgi:hypothetical protein
LGAIFGLVLGSAPFTVAAQTTEPLLPVPSAPSAPQLPVATGLSTYAGETVTTRARPDFDPIGVRMGDFFWFPHGEVDGEFNSNIFATPSQTSDWITALAPGFDILQDSPPGTPSINLHAGAATQFYAINPSQNTATGFASTNGRLPVDATSAFYGNADIMHSFTPRTSPNSPGNAAEPVTFNSYTATIGYQKTGLKLGYDAEFAVAGTQYNPVPLFGGGLSSQSASDTIIPQGSLRVSYEFIPDYLAYIRASGSYYDYTHQASNVNLDSTVYRVDTGLQILPRHLIDGEVYVGYLTQTFNEAKFRSISAPDYGGRLTWNVTGLTTLTLNGLRSFQTTNPTVSGIGSGYLESSVTASLDHELRYNLLVNASFVYENDDYTSSSQSDNVITASAGVRYLVSRNLYLGGSYNYQQRIGLTPYSQSIVMLRLGTQF